MSSSQSSTPAAQPWIQIEKPKASSSNSKSTRTTSPRFTPRMRDAQARNKNPYASDSDDSPYEDAAGRKRFDVYGNDSYEQIQLRRQAAIVLDSCELLMMHAQARNDSIPGTRHYFTKMLCGYLEASDTYENTKDMSVSAAPLPEREKERERERARVRERAKEKGRAKGNGKGKEGGAS